MIALSLLTDPGVAAPTLFLTVPLGVSVEPGVRVLIGGATWSVPIKVCFPDGCQAVLPLDDEQQKLLAGTPKAEARYFAQGTNEPLAIPISLDGLAAAIDALPKR